MSEIKAQRLGKAAKELGVSTGTIIEFLGKKGVKLDNDAMAKIEGPAYELLLAEFASDKAALEKSHAATTKARESRATITLEEAKKTRDTDKVETEPEIDYSKFKRKIEVRDKPASIPPPPPPAPPKPVADAPVAPPVEEEAAKKSTRKKVEEEAAPVAETPAPAEEKPNEPKVVGKIDLDAFDSAKTKARKKKEEAAEAVEEEKKKTTRGKKKEEEKPVEAVAPPVAAAPEEEVKPVPVEKELIRVKSEKLAGIKVMGKIELPADKRTEPAKPGESAEKRWDPLESTCRHASLSIL